MSIASIMTQINRTYGEGTVIYGSQAGALKIDRVSTGVFSLDIEIGGGLPKSRIVQIHGPWSSGKTSLAIKISQQVQMLKPPHNKVVWIDAGEGFDMDWAISLGMDMDNLIIVRPDEGPKGLDIAEEFVKSGEIGLLVVDSVAHIVPTAEIEESLENQQMGLHARLINKFIRKISMALQSKNLKEKGNPCIVLLLNQERQTMDKYHPITTPGGMGKEFAASIVIGLRRGEWIGDTKNTKKIVGHEIKFKVEKNKTFPPKKEGAFDFYFSDCDPMKAGSIDTEKSVVLYGIEREFIHRGGAIYTYNGTKFKGKSELLSYFEKNPSEVAKIKEQILAVIPVKANREIVVKKSIKFKLGKKKKGKKK